jgi:tRNA A-37 threonylcarbamoyl transferase component Bud32
MRPLLALAGLAALTLAAQTQPTFYAAYEDGLEAYGQGQWRQAAGAFLRAKALRPEPAARVIIYGNNLLKDYYPYSHLARCYLELGELEPAAAMLREAEVRGEPAGLREPLARRLTHSEPGPPKAASLPRPAPPQPAVPEPAQREPAPAAGPAPAAEPERKAPDLAPIPVPAAAVAVPAPTPALPPQAGPQVSAKPAPQPQPEPIRPLPRSAGLAGAGLLAALGLLAWSRRRPAAPAVQATPPPAAGLEAFGPYQTLRILGHGGFATTYLARHTLTGQEVALKVLHPHRLRDPEFTKRFAQEARLGALLDHPYLVRLLDPGPPEGTSWIALEYVAGPTLEAHLKATGALPVEEALQTALCIAKAIAYAHAHGVVHRDLKPGNIILGAQGPKVMDLGIARELDTHTMTTTYAFLGTPLYAAPEAQLVAKAGPASDRYSLGVILYEMLAGAAPFSGQTPFAILDQHRSAPAPDILAVREVPAALARLLRRLLDKDPDQRPEDGELVAKLERIRDHFDDSPTMPGL